MNNEQFYNHLAGSYDGMINFENALTRRIELLRPFINPEYSTAADIGCGSGIDAISLAKLGLKVVAFDPSEEMLNVAQKNAATFGLSTIEFNKAKAHEIDPLFYGNFDLLTSLGNTLSNIPPNEIETSLRASYQLLKKDRGVVFQIVNYSKLIHENKRILNITKNDLHTYVRFYDFSDSKIMFNILRFETENPAQHNLISTEVFYYSPDQLLTMLNEIGFEEIKLWGSMNRMEYAKEKSGDIVIYAKK